MFEKYLEDRVQVVEQITDWKDSIRLAAGKLLEKGYINSNYIDAMIDNVVVNGSYIIILPRIAIPHSRPETGAFKTSMSLLKLNNPVMYPEDKEVNLIMVLAANDNKSHLELIAELSTFLESRETLNEIFNATHPSQIHDILAKAKI